MALEADEPERVAEATRRMKLRHVVITAVARMIFPMAALRISNRSFRACAR